MRGTKPSGIPPTAPYPLGRIPLRRLSAVIHTLIRYRTGPQYPRPLHRRPKDLAAVDNGEPSRWARKEDGKTGSVNYNYLILPPQANPEG